MVYQSAWPQSSTASCLPSHCPGAQSQQAWALHLVLCCLPHLKYTDPDLGSGNKRVLRPSQLPTLRPNSQEGDQRMQHTAYEFSLTWSLLSLCVMRDKKMVGETQESTERMWPPLVYLPYSRLHKVSRLDRTWQNILAWKQTSRPCLTWMRLPKIAQNQTQPLVKSS